MENEERARIETLLPSHEELRQLWEEHLELERQLDELNSQMHLSPSEQVERKMIKKRKLAGKDQIAMILARSEA
ncbi:MAG: YdcH family protein [Myxococcota bacterium]